jgi:outer membrane protein
MDATSSLNKKSKFTSSIAIALLTISFNAHGEALGLTRAIDLAFDNSPEYLGARAGTVAARARLRQALAQNLPQLSATVTRNWYHRNYETLAPLFPTPPDISNYDSDMDQVTLTQPIYRRVNYASISQGRAVVRQNEYEVLATEQELLLKLAQTWLDLIVAEDTLAFTGAQVATARRQAMQVERASENALAAGPELADARAKLAQVVADHALAEVDRQEKLSALEGLLGPLPPFSVPAFGSFIHPPTDIGVLEDLLQAAEDGNPSILAAQQAVTAASKEVSKQRAGHEPTVDLVGNFSRNKQEAGNFPGQSGYDIRQRSVGVQVSVPIYSGGLQQARIDEAAALRTKASQDLESAIRTARTNVRLAWFRYKANSARVSAASQSVRSMELALRAAESGLANGLRFDVDVLRAQQDFLQAQRDLHQAQSELIVDTLRLKAAIGILEEEDVASIDSQTRERGPGDEAR